VAKDAIDKFPRDIQAMIRKPEAERTPLEQQLASLAYRQVDYEFDQIEKHVKDEKSKTRYKELTAALAKFDADKPKYEVVFKIQPYWDAREKSMAEMQPHIQKTQTLKVLYDESPPFSAGQQVSLVIEEEEA
jgi:hypothetical protein